MLAYRRTDFGARARAEAIEGWEDDGALGAAEAGELKRRFPDPFYEPNAFVRIGLFIFGFICAGSAQGLLFLMFSPRKDTATSAVLLFSGILALAGAEFLARRPRPFWRAGLEEALAYQGLACIVIGIAILTDLADDHEVATALLVAAGSGLAAARYADGLLAALSLGALAVAGFLAAADGGIWALSLLPFAAIGFAAAVAYASGRARERAGLGPWEHCFDLLRLLGLLLAYAAGNYLVVRELGKSAIRGGGGAEGPALAWFFQAWTYAVPAAYMAWGLVRKDRQALDAGLLLVAAAVGTYKYYNSTMPLEWGMVLGGLALLAVAWAALKAFRPPRFGISAAPAPRGARDILLNAEALAKAHGSTGPDIPDRPPAPPEGGGGAFGGGGAQGRF